MDLGIYRGLILGKEKLAVVGLGYVGLPVAVEFAKHISVIGFDYNKKRISDYKNGLDATKEIGEAVKRSNVDFTADPKRLSEAKFIIVAVPTPIDTYYIPDLTNLKAASAVIGRNLSKGSIVVFESTVYPGATEEVCVPIIEMESGLKCGVDWRIGYSPERINPGDKTHTLPLIRKVVAGMDGETAAEIQKVYEIIIKAGTFLVSSIKTAEAVKVIENSQRDVNIAFMNEVAIICGRLNVDTAEVIDGMNTKWNALNFRPGLVGGHCIGVDPYYLIDVAERLRYHSSLISESRHINNSMSALIADIAIEELRAAGIAPESAAVVILGFTFKENCPDIRNSRIADIINHLKKQGISPFTADPWADPEAVIEEYGIDLIPAGNLPKADCIIVAVAHDEYKALSVPQIKLMFKSCLPDNKKILLDVKSIYRLDELAASGIRFRRL